MTTYLVTFDRLGTTHSPPPLVTDADDSDDLEIAILQHSRPFHRSRNRLIVLRGDQGGGTSWIACGERNGGDFTYAVHDQPTSQPAAQGAATP